MARAPGIQASHVGVPDPFIAPTRKQPSPDCLPVDTGG